MNRNKTFFLLAILGLVVTVFPADQDTLVLKGKNGFPYFDKEGRLGLVFSTSGGRFLARNAGPESPTYLPFQDARGRGVPASFLVKKDRLNRVWIIWEEERPEGSDIFVGRIEDDRITEIANISVGFPGRNHSPDLDVSSAPRILAAWVNIHEGRHRLVVKSLYPEQSWVVGTPELSTIYTPKVLADGKGGNWVFWVGQGGPGLDEIFYSFLEEGTWMEPVSLTSGSGVPHFHPSVAVDFAGNPWIAWCGYDGEDYEIWARKWDGTRWLLPEKVTDNRGPSDVQPSLSLFLHSIPVVAWTQALEGKREINLAFKKNDGTWSRAVSVSRGLERAGSPVIVTEEDKIVVFWKSEERLFMKSFSFSSLLRKETAVEPEPTVSVSPGFLAEDRFIAFGDSITYGIIVPPWDVKEKGYVPRLESLLKSLYENPEVVNRGVPGEPTWDGLSRIGSVITMDLALYLLLMEGTNDVTQEHYSMATAAFNLKEMTKKCIQYGVFPLISTIIPRKGDRWTQTARTRTFNLNERIRQIARDLSLVLVDNFEAFFTYPPELGGWQSLIADAPDNLHPNEKGYQVMAETWFHKIGLIPFPPVDIKAGKMLREKAIHLSWRKDPKVSADTGISHYRIYRKRKTDKAFAVVGMAGSSEFLYQDRNLDLDEDYVYILSALNSSGLEGPLSGPVFPVPGDPFPPFNVKSVTAANKAFFHVEYINHVTWDGNPKNSGLFNVVKYMVYRKKRGEPDERFLPAGVVNAPQREFLDRNLPSRAAAAEYVYGVAAVDINNIEGMIGKD